MNKNKIEDSPPQQGETCVVCFPTLGKTAALLFDKIHISAIYLPSKIKESINVGENPPASLAFHISRIDEYAWRRLAIRNIRKLRESGFQPLKEESPQCIKPSNINETLRYTAEAYNEHGLSVVPLFQSEKEFAQVFTFGDQVAYQAVLAHVPLVDNKRISWEQVLEFRRDHEAKSSYRNLRFWLRYAFKGQSLDEAVNIIGQKLEDYKWAIKKHGLKTKIGAIKSLIDTKFLLGLAGGATVANILGGPIWSAMATGALTVSKMSLFIAERKLDLEDIKRKSEVALIHEITEKYGKLEKVQL